MNKETYKDGRVVERQYVEGEELVIVADGRTNRRSLTAVEKADLARTKQLESAVSTVRTFDVTKGELQDFVDAVRVLLGVE